jgi:hypothetical protein
VSCFGCDNAVDPFADADGSSPFYVFGYLDTAADTQFVRVEPIRQTHDPAGGIPPAAVRTMASTSGDAVVWQDSAVTLTDGTPGHLYFALFRPSPGETYALAVNRADGAQTTAATEVPVAPPARVDTARVITNEVVQRITWAGLLAEPDVVELVYRVSHGSGTVVEIAVDYTGRGEITDEGLVIEARLSGDREHVGQVLGEAPAGLPPILHDIAMRITILSPEWASPDAMHVANGRGFWGAVGRFQVTWDVPPHHLARLMYRSGQDTDGTYRVAKTPFH